MTALLNRDDEAPDEAAAADAESGSAAAPGGRGPRRARRLRVPGGPVTIISLGVCGLIVLVALLGPYVAPHYNPHKQNLNGAQLGLWSHDSHGTLHMLGTDPLGIDTLSQLILGARVSLIIAIFSVLISAAIGSILGALGGYYGGWVDRAVVAAIDITLAVPRVLIMIPIVAVFGSSIKLLIGLIGVTGWALFARLVRAQVMSLRQRDFVAAAVMMGSGDLALMRRHIMPNVRNSIIVLASLEIGQVIVIESGLSYLGLGVRPPNTSWGLMINAAQQYTTTQPRLLLIPSIALILLVLSINLGTRAFTSEGGAGRAGGMSAPLLSHRRRLAAAAGASLVPPQAGNEDGALLRVRDLTVSFPTPDGPVPAVDGVSFDVRPGEILGIVGESGSGKSVALSSVIGLTREENAQIGGEARFGGIDLISASETQLRQLRGKDIGVVFQNPMTSLNPLRTIGIQLSEAISLHDPSVKRKERMRRAVEALRQVGVPAPESRLKQFPHEFSGGMQQRVAIAMALINSPRLIIADEPTTALDVTIQAQVLDLLVRARDELGASIVIVTHDLGVLAEIADRIVVLYSGRVAETGDATEIFDHPAHPYTKLLHECLPSLENPVATLQTVPGQPPMPARRPSGCAFNPRCPRADSTLCISTLPVLDLVARDHLAACHHPATVLETVDA
jgi:peptide/nickel transport system permease protein